MTKERVCEICLKEMFRRVGEKYPNPKLTNQDKWFAKRIWTKEEEDDFREWMKKFLKKKFRWNKKTIDNEVEMFLLSWGWKTADTTIHHTF